MRKRENYRAAFDDFDAEKIALYDDKKLAELLQNDGIIRNRLKIASAVSNAKAFLKVKAEFGTFDSYIWSFVGGKPVINTRENMNEVPAKTEISDVLSKVTNGEADAGLIYVTDARNAGNKVTTVKFAESAGAANVYPIAVLKHASQPALAQKFIDLVIGTTGQMVLNQAGFGGP